MSNRFSDKRRDVQRPPVCKPSPPPLPVYESQAGFIRFEKYYAFVGTQINVDVFASYKPLPIGTELDVSAFYQGNKVGLSSKPKNALISDPGKLNFNVGNTPGIFTLKLICSQVPGHLVESDYSIHVGYYAAPFT